MVDLSDISKSANDRSLDPRSVCNLILDEAVGRRSITHIDLQKLLYFAHGLFLVETKRPLVSGYFEAWRLGPVHPTVYLAFKDAENQPIEFRAQSRDALTGKKSDIANPSDPVVIGCVQRIVTSCANLSTGRLIEITHAPKAPWHFIVDKARTGVAFGMRIPDSVIIERFQHHKVSVNPRGQEGIFNEDSPFT